MQLVITMIMIIAIVIMIIIIRRVIMIVEKLLCRILELYNDDTLRRNMLIGSPY